MKKVYLNNLRGLDLLRFILSVSVIVWHYQHFFYPFATFENREVFLTKQPFYELFTVFFNEGYYAVQVFWLISGVIFYKVYQERILSGKVTFGQFILNRFSRLYPLHVLTLVVVLILQQIYFQRHNDFFIYQKNTPQAFFQHLLFVQGWGDNKMSFNGPTWSVSIEVLVYFIFFCVCASGFIQKTKHLLLTFLFFMMIKKWGMVFGNEDIASSIYLFFAGCILIKSFDSVKENTSVQLLITVILFLLWFFTQHVPDPLDSIYQKVTGFLDPDLLTFSCFSVWAFIAIFNLRFFDVVPDKVYQFFGDMTYSTYLVHFPIQIVFYLIINPASVADFFSPSVFIAFLLSVFITGRLVFTYFELPVQNGIRNYLNKSKA